MPYLNTEKVSQMRQAIKAAVPSAKVSVRKNSNSSGIHITILKSKVDFSDILHNGRTGINPFHFQNQLNPKQVKLISKIVDAMNSVESRRTLYEDADYGSIPNYYYDINIGSWDKPYEQVK